MSLPTASKLPRQPVATAAPCRPLKASSHHPCGLHTTPQARQWQLHALAPVTSSTSTIQARHALTRVWRPHPDDVDRLSRGEGAKIRGTGCRDIPHRLNVEEHQVYKAAKKKSYLAVRGTGYRRERKGNPLPNVFRQWCDAKGLPCIVIEQDVLGGQLDQVVVDLSTMRLLDHDSHQRVCEACAAIAASLGVRRLDASERDATHVPFNMLPLAELITDADTPAYLVQQLTSSSTPMNVLKQQSGRGGRGGAGKGARDAVGGGETGGSRGGRRGSDASAAASASSAGAPVSEQRGLGLDARSPAERVLELEERAAQLKVQVEQQASLVRSMKEQQGRSNSDPEVQAQVQVLLALKAEAASTDEAALVAHAQAKDPRHQATSARKAAIFDAFTSSEEEDDTVDGQKQAAATASDPEAEQSAALGDAALVREEENSEGGLQKGGAKDAGAGHPYCRAAIWQLLADPLFFEADRTTAKQFARQVVEALCG